MLKKFFFFLFIIIPINAYSSSLWEGKWEVGRYDNAFGGVLIIKNCQDKICDFDIKTYNGAHMCGVDGQMKINGKTAQYHESMKISEDEEAKESIVYFQIDEQKNTITVDFEGERHFYCGLQGYFEGVYENQKNPLRYKTSYNCWQNNLNNTEKQICATAKLANADIEMNKKYPQAMTNDWKKERNICQDDVKCLWDFYVKSIKEEYEKKVRKTLNLYEYLGDLEEDGVYYPTDFTLLNDYLEKNLEDYYEAWKITQDTISTQDNQCDNCYYHKYGVTGLFTIYESAFYIDKNEIWLSFVSANLKAPEDEYIIVFAPNEKELKDMPKQFNKWLERLKPHYPKGIKLKHFTLILGCDNF